MGLRRLALFPRWLGVKGISFVELQNRWEPSNAGSRKRARRHTYIYMVETQDKTSDKTKCTYNVEQKYLYRVSILL